VESHGLSRELRFIEALCEGSGRQVAKTRLFALPVIKDLDVFADGLSGLGACREPVVVHEFVFEWNT
jgi:hypothetical protein